MDMVSGDASVKMGAVEILGSAGKFTEDGLFLIEASSDSRRHTLFFKEE